LASPSLQKAAKPATHSPLLGPVQLFSQHSLVQSSWSAKGNVGCWQKRWTGQGRAGCWQKRWTVKRSGCWAGPAVQQMLLGPVQQDPLPKITTPW